MGVPVSRIYSRLSGPVLGCFIAALTPIVAQAACGPGALGTSRTISVDASTRASFNGLETGLGLQDKEIILTFDDGPIAGRTPAVLKALADECVKATFFAVGHMAKANARIAKRIVAQGHTLGHHTHTHDRLPTFSAAKAAERIDAGIAAVERAVYGTKTERIRTPFFRYPYLASNGTTDRLVRARGMVSFGANIDSLDWQPGSADDVHDRIMRRVRHQGRGIVLMHDIQARTAKMLPRLLRTLKAEGYKIVHIVPKGTAPHMNAEQHLVVASLEQRKRSPFTLTDAASALLNTSGTRQKTHSNARQSVQHVAALPTHAPSAYYRLRRSQWIIN